MSVLWMAASVGVLCEKPWMLWRSSCGPSHPRIDGGQVYLCDQVSDLCFTQLGSIPFSSFSCSCFPHFSLPTPCLLFSSYSSVIGSQFTERAFPFSLLKVLFPERSMACFGRGRYRLGVRVTHTWAQLLLAIVINCGDQRYPFLKCLE